MMRFSVPALFLLQAGCFGLYIPDPSRAATRGSIEDVDLRPFHLQVSSREEIVLALGEPDLQSEDEKVLVYWWYHSRGFLFFMWGAPGGQGGAVAGMAGRRIFLCLKFDEAGRVIRHKFVHLFFDPKAPSAPAFPPEILTQW